MSGTGGPELVVRVSANLSELKSALAEGVTQFETTRSALNNMSNAFDGSRTLAQAGAVVGAILQIGDVTKLTSAEQAKANVILEAGLEKYKALGREAPPGMRELAAATKQAEESTFSWSTVLGKAGGILAAFGITASIAAVVNFAKGLLDDADALQFMHDKTEISVEALQRMRIAGDDAHVTLEAMTAAVTMLQKRLGGDDQSAVAALRDLGINVQQFESLGADQQMAALATAVQSTHDPLRVAHDLSGLFGKSWAEMLPVLKRGFKEVTDQTTVMSSESVKALDDFGDAAGRFWRATKGAFGEALADVLTLSLSDLRQLNSELKNLPPPPDAAAYTNFYRALVPPGIPKDLDEITQKMDAQVKAQIKTTEAMVELNSAGEGWRGTLETVNGDVAEAVKFYLQAGVAQDKLATAYGLTATQIKSVASELHDEQAALKLEAASVEQVSKLWDEFNEIASHGGSAFDDQVAAIDRWALDLEAKAQKAGTDTAAFYDALTALWSAKLRAAAQSTASAVQDTVSSAESSFQQLNDDVMEIVTSFHGWNDAIMQVNSSLKQLRTGNTLDVSTAAQDPEIMALLKTGWSLKNAEAIKLGRQWGFAPQLFDARGNPESSPSPGERVPGYKDGGPTVEGPAYLHANEYVVPKGGALVMSGGGSTTIQIYVTQPLGTPAAIAAAVDQALMARRRNIGQGF